MKKLIYILMFFLVLSFIFYKIYNKYIEDEVVMAEINDSNSFYYSLNFNSDALNFRNFKVKLGLFTSYNYYIKKVYIKYPQNIKEKLTDKKYFSFDNYNFNDGIQKVKNEYIILLRENHLYDELEKDLDNTMIERVDLYCDLDALTKFKKKFPNVIVTELQ